MIILDKDEFREVMANDSSQDVLELKGTDLCAVGGGCGEVIFG